MSDKYLTKIAALLRKAETTDNEHEADAFLQAAQRLATLSSVDLAVARAHSTAKEARAVPTQRTITIGEAGKRGLRTFVQLFLEIGRANNLTCDIARDSTRVYAYGFDTDIDTVEALYTSLVIQMVRASDEYIKSKRYTAEKVGRWIEVPTTGPLRRRPQYEWQEKPVHATTARVNFQQAFASRIGARLQEATRTAREQAVADDTGGATGVAVVLRAREVELRDHYKATSTARGHWRGTSANSGYSELASKAGDRAGRTARLGAERAIGGHRPAVNG
ncbi:Protein of unknown function [Nakamurella panacisegetis]|uniref:DUF2786 domain-containing protein n=1 Tax=Nakamurella panacisegetis TaxID=1090615 RepID=A0A1H0SDC1_9ACTN|nr:DUF2786 domain-containing protein [Nakamurella panacisegetis]SDP39655.1 Protein of unknown function [Nakamurella panacisegetis]